MVDSVPRPTIVAIPPVGVYTYSGFGSSELIASPSDDTFSVDIGAASADRYILVGISHQDGASDIADATVTVNGVSLTKLTSSRNPLISSDAYAAMFGGIVAAGAGSQSVHVVVPVTLSGGYFRTYAVWRLSGFGLTPTPQHAVSAAGNTSVDTHISVQAGDFIFACAYGSGGTTGTAWSASTEPLTSRPEYIAQGGHYDADLASDLTVVATAADFWVKHDGFSGNDPRSIVTFRP